jgi:stage V sporulation protein S
MEPDFSNVEEPQSEEVLQPEPEEESVVAPEARPSGPRPSILKVSAHSRPSSVAGAIAGVVRETGRAEVQAIGAGATNQAVKAIAIARSYLQEDGIDIVCVPSFAEVLIEQEERTAIRLVVEKR